VAAKEAEEAAKEAEKAVREAEKPVAEAGKAVDECDSPELRLLCLLVKCFDGTVKPTTSRQVYGMRCRGPQLSLVQRQLSEFGEMKERQPCFAVVASPRQGKTLFLDELSRHGALTIGNSNTATVITVTYNVTCTACPEDVVPVGGAKVDARWAAACLYARVLNKLMRDTSSELRNIARLIIQLSAGKMVGEAFRHCLSSWGFTDVVVCVDEFTKLYEQLVKCMPSASALDVESMQREIGSQITSFISDRTALVLSGFQSRVITLSKSDRKVVNVSLSPIIDARSRRHGLPLKALFFWQRRSRPPVAARPGEPASHLVLYELSKASLGILGHLVDGSSDSFEGIPNYNSLRSLNESKRKEVYECAAAYFAHYIWNFAEKDTLRDELQLAGIGTPVYTTPEGPVSEMFVDPVWVHGILNGWPNKDVHSAELVLQYFAMLQYDCKIMEEGDTNVAEIRGKLAEKCVIHGVTIHRGITCDAHQSVRVDKSLMRMTITQRFGKAILSMGGNPDALTILPATAKFDVWEFDSYPCRKDGLTLAELPSFMQHDLTRILATPKMRPRTPESDAHAGYVNVKSADVCENNPLVDFVYADQLAGGGVLQVWVQVKNTMNNPFIRASREARLRVGNTTVHDIKQRLASVATVNEDSLRQLCAAAREWGLLKDSEAAQDQPFDVRLRAVVSNLRKAKHEAVYNAVVHELTKVVHQHAGRDSDPRNVSGFARQVLNGLNAPGLSLCVKHVAHVIVTPVGGLDLLVGADRQLPYFTAAGRAGIPSYSLHVVCHGSEECRRMLTPIVHDTMPDFEAHDVESWQQQLPPQREWASFTAIKRGLVPAHFDNPTDYDEYTNTLKDCMEAIECGTTAGVRQQTSHALFQPTAV
jgi:hypothetical protein